MKNSRYDFVAKVVHQAILDCFAADGSGPPSSEDPLQLFHSPAANAIKEEMVRTGRKLWERQYVDGNGGNISARLSPKYVLCTPTLCSKGDLRVEDLSLVDAENRQVCGSKAQTSEILLHLEIYKTVPEAKAVIHCHPPYATAHAVAGVVPQGNLVPEQAVFIGPVALTPYETPGTKAFARTVAPVVKQHNTILLSHHGIVCWADTITHAEWYAEVVETYCKTIMIASQLKSPLSEIPADKISDLLAIKRKLGLPDARLPVEPDSIPDNVVEIGGPPSYEDVLRHEQAAPFSGNRKEDVDQLVSSLTARILGFIDESL